MPTTPGPSKTLVRILCPLLYGLALVFFSGCSGIRMERDYATPRVANPLRLSTWGLYVPNRIFDALDIPVAGVQVGPGLNVRGQATNLFTFCQPMNSAGPEIGWNTHWIDPIKPKDFNYFWKRYRPGSLGVHGGKAVPFPLFDMNLGELDSSPDTIALGVHLLVVGVNVGLRPVDLADFVTGFVLIDLNRDDLTVKKKSKARDSEEEDEDE